MISSHDKEIVQEISERYGVTRVLLFGSSVRPDRESRDIDIAVEGLPPRDFYSYYGDLILALSKPVDVIDLAGTSKFVRMIKEEGVLLYG